MRDTDRLAAALRERRRIAPATRPDVRTLGAVLQRRVRVAGRPAPMAHVRIEAGRRVLALRHRLDVASD